MSASAAQRRAQRGEAERSGWHAAARAPGPEGAVLMRLSIVLLTVEFADELVSGIPALAAPQIQPEFGVSYGEAAGWLVFAFGLGSLAEPPLLLLAEGRSRRRFLSLGLLALAAVSLGAAAAPSYPLLFATLALWGLASGVGVSLSQATLMDAYPERRERMLMRWVLLGASGDLATSVLLAALAALALGWRSAFLIGAGVFLLCLLALPHRVPAARERSEPPEPGVRSAIRDAMGAPRLWLWLSGAMLCALLDEPWVAFGSLWLRDELGASVAERSLVFGSFAVASMLGLAAQERLVDRFPPARLLAAEAVATALALCAWIAAPGIALSAVCAAALGLTCSGLYPLAKARAYAALPGRGATVAAISSVFGWLELALPAGLAIAADGFGLRVVLWLLLAQPLGLLAVVALDRRAARRTARGSLSS